MKTKEQRQNEAINEIYRIAANAINNKAADEQHLRKALVNVRDVALETVR